MKIKFHITWLIFAALTFIQTSLADNASRSVYVCRMTNWIQVFPEGDLRYIERPEASLFSFIIENSKLNFVSDDMTNNTLEVVYSSPAPEFRATVDAGVQGVETLYYRKGLFSFAAQKSSGIEVVSAHCDAMSKS